MAKSFVVHTLPKMLGASKKEELTEANTDRGGSMGNMHIAKHAQRRIRTLLIRLRSAAAVADSRPGPSPVTTSAVLLFYLCYFDALDLAAIDFSFSES